METEFHSQLPLFPTEVQDEALYGEVFKHLYYHLYSNSDVARSERIVEDVSKVLLCKLAAERHGLVEALNDFTGGRGTANECLLPLLTTIFPNTIEQNDRFSIGDDSIRRSLSLLSCVNLHAAPAHVIGDAFQSIMGPRLRGDKGQFFTPKSLVKAMAEIVEINDGDKVVDPACGTGGFLAEAYALHRSINPIGIDKDRDLWRLSTALLEIATDGASQIHHMNSLDIENVSQIPDRTSPFNADVVLTNPPFGAKIGVTQRNILSQYQLGHHWSYSKSTCEWERHSMIRKTQDPQILFLELCIKLLKPGGKLAIVLPEGVFGNRSSRYVWSYLQSQGSVFALMDCPRTTFQPSTDTKTNVLFFRKSSSGFDEKKKKFWVGVALSCGHDRRGRQRTPTGQPYRNDFALLAREFPRRYTNRTAWTECTRPDNHYYVPRFYDRRTNSELESLLRAYGGRLATVEELVNDELVSISKGHEVGSDAYGSGEVPFVRTSDIANLEINPNQEKAISEEIYRRYASLQSLTAGDILLVVDGRYRIGRSAILTKYNTKCVIQSHLRIIKVAPTATFTPFELLYVLNMRPILHQMRNLVFIQSTLGSLGKRLLHLKLILPDPTQKWHGRVQDFENMILTRSRMLARLKDITSPEIDL